MIEKLGKLEIFELNKIGVSQQSTYKIHVICERRKLKSGISSNLSRNCIGNRCRGTILSREVLILGKIAHETGISVDTSLQIFRCTFATKISIHVCHHFYTNYHHNFKHKFWIKKSANFTRCSEYFHEHMHVFRCIYFLRQTSWACSFFCHDVLN